MYIICLHSGGMRLAGVHSVVTAIVASTLLVWVHCPVRRGSVQAFGKHSSSDENVCITTSGRD